MYLSDTAGQPYSIDFDRLPWFGSISFQYHFNILIDILQSLRVWKLLNLWPISSAQGNLATDTSSPAAPPKARRIGWSGQIWETPIAGWSWENSPRSSTFCYFVQCCFSLFHVGSKCSNLLLWMVSYDTFLPNLAERLRPMISYQNCICHSNMQPRIFSGPRTRVARLTTCMMPCWWKWRLDPDRPDPTLKSMPNLPNGLCVMVLTRSLRAICRQPMRKVPCCHRLSLQVKVRRLSCPSLFVASRRTS